MFDRYIRMKKGAKVRMEIYDKKDIYFFDHQALDKDKFNHFRRFRSDQFKININVDQEE